MLIAALFGSSFVAVRFVESGVITKNWRKVPAVKKYQTFDILIIYWHNEAKVFFNLTVLKTSLELGGRKAICSRALCGIGGDHEKLVEGSSCEKIDQLLISLLFTQWGQFWLFSWFFGHFWIFAPLFDILIIYTIQPIFGDFHNFWQFLNWGWSRKIGSRSQLWKISNFWFIDTMRPRCFWIWKF